MSIVVLDMSRTPRPNGQKARPSRGPFTIRSADGTRLLIVPPGDPVHSLIETITSEACYAELNRLRVGKVVYTIEFGPTPFYRLGIQATWTPDG